MTLQTYRRKRSFDTTPEPAGERAQSDNQLRFVIQKHDASRLHYDLRLENGGELISWAVPKGPSLNPQDKRLAMMTENHPYDYQYFEGVIPKGSYGAGQVIIWDRGTFTVDHGQNKKDQEKMFRHGLHKGKVTFHLSGEKLKGEYTLVKQRGKEDNAWLLIKKKDDKAGKDDITVQDQSVVSGKRVEEISENVAFNLQEWQDCIDKYELPDRDIARPVKPMLATLVDEPFSHKDWLYEVKWDGYRAIAELSGEDVKLYSRNNKDFKNDYPAIAEALSDIDTSMVIDGEIVVLDANGKPQFNALQNYQSDDSGQLAYYVFDLLWLDGYDLTSAPLHIRKTLLKKALPESLHIRYSDHIERNGEQFFRLAGDQDLEGIIAKKADSAYAAGKRTKTWLKIKTVKRQEAVIGGFTEPRGSRQGLGALILGVHKNGELVYVGHSGSGLSNDELARLRQRLERIERKTSPFKEEPKPNAPVHWVSPKLLCEVEFSEWTKNGHMRHPRIVGIRTDKPPKTVVRESPMDKDEAIEPDIQFTNLDKIFWPEKKRTKGDLIDYYREMARFMMPYVIDRPMTLLRHPNGIRGKSFFQKDMRDSLPEGFRTFRRYSESNKKDVHYFVCDSKAALLYMVQLGCIEINPWNSTVTQPDRPDWLVLDLDPEDIGFEQVVEVALTCKQLLDEIGVPSFPKTSGKTGMHIYLPLHAKYDYVQTKQFAEVLAQTVVQRKPDITSVERSPSKRQGKVYVDFLQNSIGQTLASPYSVRPTLEATVAMPLSWDDVNQKLRPTDFTMEEAPRLARERKDPWREFSDKSVSIERALEKLS